MDELISLYLKLEKNKDEVENCITALEEIIINKLEDRFTDRDNEEIITKFEMKKDSIVFTVSGKVNGRSYSRVETRGFGEL